MCRRILVPLDGSQLGERALPAASALAMATGARIILMRSIVAPGLTGVHVAKEQWSHGEEAEAYLHGVEGRLAEQGVLADIAVTDDPPAEGILSHSTRQNVDLIVMSSHGRSGLGRWVYGSVTEAILTRSKVPVLLVRGAAPELPLIPQAARARLLVPLDGSELAEAALPLAASLSRSLGATVVLFRTFSPATPQTGDLAFMGPLVKEDVAERERVAAGTYLRAIADRLTQQRVRTRVITHVGPAAEAIIEASRTASVVMIVMATHGRTGLERLQFGSVTTEVLHRSDLPLLLVRPAALAHGQTA